MNKQSCHMLEIYVTNKRDPADANTELSLDEYAFSHSPPTHESDLNTERKELRVVLACIMSAIQFVPHRQLLAQSLECRVQTQLSCVLLLLEYMLPQPGK